MGGGGGGMHRGGWGEGCIEAALVAYETPFSGE